ncbi:HD domain-containing protein [Aliikangiella coralliicola]|uniref:HD domain-containing protein n=1 Tax=Aliikangiella coralliicola TaxID=2592383 RepID=UPI001FE970EF|nr:HD domain-containing protein [Aliikangiella coralliicola]
MLADFNDAGNKAIIYEQREYLLELLLSLDGIIQSPEYHPESDALYHTLQVFELAYQNSADPELWLAALFHDVGKSVDSKNHAQIGAEMVAGLFPERVVWLIEHHLDLMISPGKTRQRLANTQRLTDLTQLRNWDLAGRSPTAIVRLPDEALDITLSVLSHSI